MPFDQFSIEQIAGDMLPGSTLEQKVASGFHRNTLHNTEGGTDKEEDRVKKTVDRINTIGTIWLGLTVGCAQCHTHKYDPITQREYYSMYSFLNSIDELDIDAPLPIDVERLAAAKKAFQSQLAKLKAELANYEKTKLAAALANWEKTIGNSPGSWDQLKQISAISANKATLKQQKDGSILVSGNNAKADVYTIQGTSSLGSLTALRLEALPDKSLPKSGPGRSSGGNFVLTTLSLFVIPPDKNAKPINVPLLTARADYSQKGWPVAHAINSNPTDGWAVGSQIGKRHVAVFETKQAVKLPKGSKVKVVLDHQYKGGMHNIGRFRLSLSDAKSPVSLEGLPGLIVKILATPAQQRDSAQKQQLTAYYRDIDPEAAKLRKKVSDFQAKAPKNSVKAQTVVQLSQPRKTHIHIRGDFLNKGEPVETDTIEILPPLRPRSKQPDRLDLAHWLFDPANPLPARVTVNRIWQRIFGQGIVLTSDDFGTQGEKPSHPQLLDWLAGELVRSDWSLKHMIGTIVTSSTYRQSSATRTDLIDFDPENALLARQVRRRVESEIIRDLSLSASGLLETKLGGPSVRPPQPSEYSKLTYAGGAKWQVSNGGDRYRRGLYTFFQRTSPYPMLMTFDAPDSNICMARRSMSNTPLQALALWNDPVFVEVAQALGRRIVRESPQVANAKAAADKQSTLRNRAGYAFKLCLARQPKPQELSAVIELYQAQYRLCSAAPESAAEIVGKQPLPENISNEELAAWVIVGRSLVNLDEFITRE